MIRYLKYKYILNICILSWTIPTFGKEFEASKTNGRTELINGTDSFMEILPAFEPCSTWENCDFYYTGNSDKFTCRFPKALFEEGIEFGSYNDENGWNTINAEIDNSSISSDDKFYKKTLQINFTRSDTSKLFCQARRKDSGELYKVFKIIQVTESIPVNITNWSKNITLESDEKVNLSCTATGHPSFHFTWKKDGKKIDLTSNEDNGENTRTSYLKNIHMEDNSTSVFSCTASNYKTSDTRYISVRRIDSRVPVIHWILLITFLTGVIIALLSTTVFGRQRISLMTDYLMALSMKQFKILGEITDGNFGKNDLAEMMAAKGNPNKKVVIKKLKFPEDNEHSRCWKIELDIHKKLHKHRKHDSRMNYIVEYIGFLWDPRGAGYYQIILEYCEEKDLRAFLQKHKPPPPSFSGYEDPPNWLDETPKPEVDITLKMQMQWCYEVASAMEFLAKNRVIHGDLAARNVLLKKCHGKFVATVTDFGLSKQLIRNEKGEYVYISENEDRSIPVALCSIEVLESLEGRKFTEFSDVWAFGVFMYEVFSFGDEPYSQLFSSLPENVTKQEGLKQFLNDRGRLDKPLDTLDSIYEIMERCWEKTPSERGTFSELKNKLGKLITSMFGPIEIEIAPDKSANFQPEESVNSQPEESVNPQPEESVNSQPEESVNSQPEESVNSQPEESVNSQPHSSLNPSHATILLVQNQETVSPPNEIIVHSTMEINLDTQSKAA